MFGQGNYPPRFGQGSITPMPTFQQRPVATPSPPFHQGPPASQPSTTQQAPPSVAPHVGYSGHFIYQHAPTPPVQQVSRVQPPTSGMLNAGQSILPPPPPPPLPPPPPPPLPPQQVHGSTSVTHSHPAAQHNSQWIQTMHHTPPPVPPPFGQPPTGPNRPEMFQPSIPPRVLPTLASQGQIPCRGPIHLPQSGSMHGSQQIPLPPAVPQPTSSFFTPVPFGSFLAPQNSNVLAMGPPPPPPPPPSSPPPLPPSPPPPNSPHPSFGTLSSTPPRPTLPLTDADLSHHSESDPTSSCSGFEVMAPDSVNKVVVTTQIRDTPAHDDFTNLECKSSCEVGSPMEDDLSSAEGMKLDISPPPSKPAEEKVVQQIKILCDLIAKNGPGFEDMARQKECVNPEFQFLFGGEPGSEAAVAHQYFKWMKRKYIFSGKLQHRHSSSASRPSDMDTATQTKSLRGATVPHSPSDSDMDMEDDITQPDEVQRVYNSFEGLNRDTVLMPKELDFQEQLRTEKSAVEHKLAKDISGSSGQAEQEQNAVDDSLPKDAISGSSGLVEQEKKSKLFLDHSRFTYGGSLFKVDSSVKNSAGTAECPSNSDLEKSFVPPLEDLSQSNLSAAAAVIGFEKVPGELIKGASPFRLIQDYASDDSSGDDEKPCLEDVSPVTASPSTTAGAKGLHEDIGSNLLIHPGSKSLSSSEMAFGMLSESVVVYSQSMPSNDLEFLPESQSTSREANMISIATVKAKEPVDINNGNQELVDNAVFPEASKQEDALVGVHDATPWSTKSQTQKEDIEYTSALPKVDEFGRLVREGASDSDDSHNTGRHGKRRRSRSHSRSPHDRRRSPWRRKENQSRSRGLSPKRRRSRSRSPSYRRGGESGGDKMRMDKGQLPQCYNFLQGRCHRGAFCRYMHHDSDKSDVARRYKSKQHYVEVPPVSKTTDFNEDIIKKITPKRTVHEQDIPGSSFSALEGGDMDKEKVFVIVQDTVQTLTSDQDDKSLVPDVAKSERAGELTAIVEETPDIKEEIQESSAELPNNINCLKLVELVQPVEGSPSRLLTDAGAPKSPGVTSLGIASLNENSVLMHSQVNSSLPVLQKVDHQPQNADSSDSSLIQGSTAFQNQLPVCESHLSKISSVQSYPVDFLDRHSQLSPPLPSLSQGKSTSSPKLPREMVQPTSKVSSLSPPMENCPPYQAPLQKQHSHVTEPSSSSWYLPPPPPLPPQLSLVNNLSVTAVTAMQSVPSLHFQQNQLPPRNDFTSQTFVTPYPHEMLNHSQLSDFQHRSYPLMQAKGPARPSLHMEDFRQKPLPMTMSNPMSQPFGGGGLGLVGENHLSRFPVQGINPPNSSAQGNIHLQPGPSLRDSAARIMLPFRGDNLPSDEFSTASSQKHPYSLQQRSLYGIQQSAVHGLSENLGDHENISSTMSRYTSDLERNQASHLSDFGGSRISNHYNPYASTFDQPLRSKFSSNSFKQDMAVPYSNPYDATYSLSHLPVDGEGVGSLGSRHMATLPKSSRGIDLPRSSSDQYDPIFDSIEPSSNSFKKFDHGLGQELPLDVEENNKKKEVEAVAVTTSIKSENDEYGETEDAEVGDVENLSASNPLDEANTGVGDIEIDQVKTPGKSKKSKDSRSMKLFKVALADFVKEVLKPSWRQGNMSKEAFKTIVKKTVDKVSGAMKSHQLPKSQAKINRYIDSSQRKLTKLVMGYVQKYAKG